MATTIDEIDLTRLAPPPVTATLRGIADGFKAFQILRAGFSSGLFDWLGRNGPAEKSAIATATGLRGAHLGGFLQALEDLGLLAHHEQRYALAQGMEAVLCANSPWCQAQAIGELLAPGNGWSDLARFLSDTWLPTAVSPPSPAQHPFLGDACRLARHLRARRGTAPLGRLLCFDSGDGLLAAALAEHFPDTDITVAVAPSALARTRQTLGARPSGSRCRVVTGSPLDPPAAEVFDQVVVFHALYPVRRAMSDALVALASTLVPGGELVLAHWFCLEACETAPGGLRALDKAVLTDSHPLCHVEGFCARLESAGLIGAERADLESDYGLTKLHFARCPGAHEGQKP